MGFSRTCLSRDTLCDKFYAMINCIGINNVKIDWFWLIDWSIDDRLIILRPAQWFFTYLPVKGPMLGAQSLWAGRDFYRVTPAVIRDLGFSGLIRSTAPFSRLLWHTRGCRESILTWILTGSHSVASCDTQGDSEDLFLPVSSRVKFGNEVNTLVKPAANRAVFWGFFCERA
jgi:hypothetical protein